MPACWFRQTEFLQAETQPRAACTNQQCKHSAYISATLYSIREQKNRTDHKLRESDPHSIHAQTPIPTTVACSITHWKASGPYDRAISTQTRDSMETVVACLRLPAYDRLLIASRLVLMCVSNPLDPVIFVCLPGMPTAIVLVDSALDCIPVLSSGPKTVVMANFRPNKLNRQQRQTCATRTSSV